VKRSISTPTFPIAVLTDGLEHLSLTEAAQWCADRGVTGLELGTGGYSAAPHLRVDELLDERAGTAARETLQTRLADAGVRLVALNASGNPLHPDPSTAAAHARALRDAITLAHHLGIGRVVAMSGCPGGPGPTGSGSWPTFAGGAWLPDMEGLWPLQFAESIEPFWRDLSAWAMETAPGVRICLELHPGTSVYNAESFERLREVTGENIAVNLDPSHFWWQGIDPIATVKRLGDAIGFVHGKDTLLHPERIAMHGVLDFRWPADADTMPWHFAAVGHGRPVAEWAALLATLADHGYDGPISIEHEDPNLEPEAGIDASIAGLTAAKDVLAQATGAAVLPSSADIHSPAKEHLNP
jgi:sugar phosphate isomerase/epimerase